MATTIPLGCDVKQGQYIAVLQYLSTENLLTEYQKFDIMK